MAGEWIFFDFAGTLAEGVPNWEHPQVAACAEIGLAVTPADVKAAIWHVWGPREGGAHQKASASQESYHRWIGAIEREILAGLGLTPAQLDRATPRVMALQVDPASYRIYPDAEPALASLRRRGAHLGIVSNFAWELPELVAGLGLADWFDLILTSARAGYRKPRPEIFRLAVERAGVEPDRALYVGDDPVCDRDGARGVGMPALLIDRRQAAAPRQRRIRSLEQIESFLAFGGTITGEPELRRPRDHFRPLRHAR